MKPSPLNILIRLLFAALVALALTGCTLCKGLFLNAPGYTDQFRFESAEVGPAESLYEFMRPEQDLELGSKVKVIPTFVGLETMTMDEALQESPTQAFLILRNDSLIYEGYFDGYGPEDPMTSFSVAKTFTGCLLAIAMEEGHVKSLDEPVQKYLSDFPFDDVTIDHLVNHTSGLKFPAEWKIGRAHV